MLHQAFLRRCSVATAAIVAYVLCASHRTQAAAVAASQEATQIHRASASHDAFKDCVRRPRHFHCTCMEQQNACKEEVFACESARMDILKRSESIEKMNYNSKFDHPLLNTLELDSRSQRLRGNHLWKPKKRTCVQETQDCMAYFFACDEALTRVRKRIDLLEGETVKIIQNPLSVPGLY
mmetsp:Transcript_76430/g.126766  ORF Transcript_76430/g.126766 Transcript_76430/m.126766 type:complete len:180 (+) Transcript_76430:97-636(+)